MSASGAPQPRLITRLVSVLSPRTISGKLIIGLIVLFGLASIIVSVITANTLQDSLWTSLNSRLQAASMQYYGCQSPPAQPGTSQLPGDGDAGCGPAAATKVQAPETFLASFKAGQVSNPTVVGRTYDCHLTQAELTALEKLPVSGKPGQLPTYTVNLPSAGGEFEVTAQKAADGTTLFTGLPLSGVTRVLSHVEDTEHLVFGGVLLLAVIMCAWLVQFSLRPLRRVTATATRVTELPLDSGDITLPAGVPDSDPRTEVGRVGAAFNRMLFHVERALGRRAASEARLRRFAADASHELRTPLSAIRGYAELALRHPGPVPEEVTHALTRVQSESVRMTVLVDDLLLLARLDAGRPLEREPVDMSRLAIETTMDARVARTDHRYRLDLPDEPVQVPGDEHRLHQVLANLLSNAGKHTPPGTTVSVTLTLAGVTAGTEPGADDPRAPGDYAVVHRGVPPLGPRIELSVTDDGPGIPPELLPELFERFTRADTSRAREVNAAGKSTGLGLAIVDAVVAAHGGCIAVTSKPGMTRFTIMLPMAPEPAGQPQSSAV
jgi:two-component system OmpR family sensor kinase